ncbi:MAG: benzoyl-CoA 2,3-epoxidase subunit BoxB [Acidobacteriota bacterium]|nr:benzoyl-CoA 2,3-epoxidase subunit BoxB [Blastocatellia bacterium]MDW8412548.1 benzoyl-CoA 2,3-epoxidase subunit BoxB [Acidobacteriota bacterium]
MFEKIPNNVNLSENKRLQRALEQWQPNFIRWWMEMGPEGFQQDEVYLRTAISVDSNGWAQFDYVKMPDYRWGIFLVPAEPDRKIHFGDHIGEPVWNDVPGEFRKELRRIIVTQGDTEPASVEQQRLLGHTTPSLYDLRNLFQVNVEEGRHLWAMVYLLHQFFGRDGREEAEDLLTRRSGHKDTPRILEAFNKPVRDWLAFFAFTMFTDRDGKYQLAALAESAFDPLARSTKFMLTEEAHHLFVGETGIARIVKRTAELMKLSPNEDVTELGGIPLDIIQKYINEWFSASLDLFGSEDSSNAATFFGAGLKGRYREAERYSDHLALEGSYKLEVPDENGHLVERSIPLRRAMNIQLQDAYIEDCERALRRWNEILEKAGLSYRLKLPSQRFNRRIGVFSSHYFTPEGKIISESEFKSRSNQWLPTQEDYAYVSSLMTPVYERGKIANWIAPPTRGINQKPIDFEYVRR